jgi:hypothetical protein
MKLRRIFDRLRTGWTPGDRELADAPIVNQWRVLSIEPGPYLLQGTVGGRPVLKVLIALDVSAGWGRAPDGWLMLGIRSAELQRVVGKEEVMSRAAEWIDAYPDESAR